jgi:hypothetical protein
MSFPKFFSTFAWATLATLAVSLQASPGRCADFQPPVKPVYNSQPAEQSSLSDDGDNYRTLILIVFVVLWLGLVNLPPVRRWQIYRLILKNRISELPDTDRGGLVMNPATMARSFLHGANGDQHSKVSEHLSFVPKNEPVWRGPLNGDDWFSRLFCSDLGFIEMSAHNSNTPVVRRKRFWLGERNPVWSILLALCSFGLPVERRYEESADGELSLVFVSPFFRLTWLGTVIPSRGFVLRVSPRGVPSVVGLVKARQVYPDLPLYPAAVAELYAQAYASWNGGFRDRILFRSRPLSFYQEEYDPTLASARIERFVGLGNQYTVLLGPSQAEGGALSSVILFDVHTGRIRLWQRPADTTVYGPIEALSTVRSEFGRGNYRHVAPRLICHRGKIFWLVSQLSLAQEKNAPESTGMRGHYLIDAATNNVIYLSGSNPLFHNARALDNLKA